MSQTYSVRDICDRYAVGEHTVLRWIRNGELKAIDVSRRLGGKPRWRITAEALAAFEQLRTPSPPPPPVKRNRRRADVVEFYK
jgi:excisionase family DNA binding protein